LKTILENGVGVVNIREDIAGVVESLRPEMVKFLVDLCSIPAVNPSFGGEGEYRRAKWLANFLEEHDLPVQIMEVDDHSVPEGKRLNLVSRLRGSGEQGTLWIAAHMDTVAAGDMNTWETDPFSPVVRDGRIYGRGVEDNGQAIACMVYSLITLKRLGLQPKKDLGLLFVSDEEAGSTYGLKFLAEEGLFKPEDEALVPDAGCTDGSFIEVAEKSILWCRFTVVGKETHASRPHYGINAGWVGSLFAVELIETLRRKYRDRDILFDPPFSTFELTQKFANVSSPNVVPGKDVFTVDFRILPSWKLDAVVSDIDQLVTKYEYEHKVEINYDFPQRVDAPLPTSPESAVVKNLSDALKQRGLSPKIGGIGGGTCAAILREMGIPAVVWSTLDELAHQPNEYAIIDNLVEDTKTFIALALA
jgi:succinyl-diaminopimelate desuccinylase